MCLYTAVGIRSSRGIGRVEIGCQDCNSEYDCRRIRIGPPNFPCTIPHYIGLTTGVVQNTKTGPIQTREKQNSTQTKTQQACCVSRGGKRKGVPFKRSKCAKDKKPEIKNQDEPNGRDGARHWYTLQLPLRRRPVLEKKRGSVPAHLVDRAVQLQGHRYPEARYIG